MCNEMTVAFEHVYDQVHLRLGASIRYPVIITPV